MPHAPPLHEAPRYPLVSFMMVAAVLLSLWNRNAQIPEWVLGDGISLRTPWVLVTSAFFHGDPAHLIFNLLWLWSLGTRAEWAWGTGRTVLIMIFLAAISSGTEQAITGPCIGLSGVGYGLWGLLATAQRRVPRLAGSIDKTTSQLFIIWFFACIIMTALKEMNVANIAHGAGAAGGWALAHCMTARHHRGLWIAGTTLVSVVVLVLALR